MRNNLFGITLMGSILACMTLMVAGGAEALIMIDDWSVPHNMTHASMNSSIIVQEPGTESSPPAPLGAILGGYRDVRLHQVSGAGAINFFVNTTFNGFSEEGDFASNPGVGGHHHTTYDGLYFLTFHETILTE